MSLTRLLCPSVLLTTFTLIFGCADRCEPTTGVPEQICLPAAAAPNVPLTLRARESCGGCGGPSYNTCSATLVGAELRLSYDGQICELPEGTACATVCVVRELDCPTPPLAPGTYQVVGFDDGHTETLTVAASASATRCDLPPE